MKKHGLLQILILAFLASCMFAGKIPDRVIITAYDLRMDGKVDDAKAMLDTILARDSTSAMAYFEAARLKHYMLTGGGGTKIDDIVTAVDRAVYYDPENVIYAYYKAIATFLNAFMSMQTGQGDIKDNVAKTAAQFEKVLELKPDYYEAMLYLVEIYGMLPRDMGGDSAKAATYAEKLAGMNGYFGAKAQAALAPEGTDLVKFWDDRMVLDGRKPDYLMEAGKACLFADDPAKAEKYFDEAIKSDPSKNILILDLARYHMMMVMQNKDLADSELPLAKELIERYLKTLPEPIVPIKAYAIGLLARTEMFGGNQDGAQELMEEAKSVDKYFSRASGIPMQLLFDPPDQVSHHFTSFFSPF